MIKLKIKEVAERQGLNLQELSNRSGIAYSTVVDLWHDRTRRIDRGTLEKVCRALGVQPGDLIVLETAEKNLVPGRAALVAA